MITVKQGLTILSRRFRNARFLTISLVIHLILAALLGGVVLFKAASSPESFVVGQNHGFLSEEAEVDQAEPLSEPAEFEEPLEPIDSSLPQSYEASAIQSTAALADFSIRGTFSAQTMGTTLSGSLTSVSAGSSGGGRARMGSGGFFGVRDQSAKGLVGLMYDLKQYKNGKPTDITPEEYGEVVASFAKSWNTSKLNEYFRAPTVLTASQIFTPNLKATEAPKAFGVEETVQPSRWVALYRARVSPPASGTYHFVGAGDDIMFVRFNGKVVLDRCWSGSDQEAKAVQNYDYGFSKIKKGFAKGTGVRADKGKFYDLDILIGEQPGGKFFACLLLEEEGVSYEKDAKGNPILPIFRVADELLPKEGNMSFPPHTTDGPIWTVQPPR